MSRLVKIVMTRAQANQMLWYIDRCHGEYYGEKKHFNQREHDLIEHILKGIKSSDSDEQ